MVALWRDPDESRLPWFVVGIGTRIMIAAAGSAEATFYPLALRGTASEALQTVAFFDGIAPQRPGVRLSLRGETAELVFSPCPVVLVVAPVASVAPERPARAQGSAEPFADSEQDSVREARRPLLRAWLLMGSGWLNHDTVEPLTELDTHIVDEELEEALKGFRGSATAR